MFGRRVMMERGRWGESSLFILPEHCGRDQEMYNNVKISYFLRNIIIAFTS
jgi:hypothetical protein